MKTLKFLLLLFTVTAFGLTSCKKTPVEEAKPDNQAQIEAKSKALGKWYIIKAVFNKKQNGVDHFETTVGYANDQFFNFIDNKNLQISYAEKKGTFTYGFTEDVKTLTTSSPNDIYAVQELSSTTMILLKTHSTGPNGVTEEITLSRTPAQ